MPSNIYISIMPVSDGTFRTVMIDAITEKYIVSPSIHLTRLEAEEAATILSNNTPEEIGRLFKEEIEKQEQNEKEKQEKGNTLT